MFTKCSVVFRDMFEGAIFPDIFLQLLKNKIWDAWTCEMNMWKRFLGPSGEAGKSWQGCGEILFVSHIMSIFLPHLFETKHRSVGLVKWIRGIDFLTGIWKNIAVAASGAGVFLPPTQQEVASKVLGRIEIFYFVKFLLFIFRKCSNVHSVCTNFCLNLHGVCTNLCLNVHRPCLLCSPFEYGKGMYKFVFYA